MCVEWCRKGVCECCCSFVVVGAHKHTGTHSFVNLYSFVSCDVALMLSMLRKGGDVSVLKDGRKEVRKGNFNIRFRFVHD